MCYAAPGPRCSGHARKDLEKALAAFKQADTALHDAQAEIRERVGRGNWQEEDKARQGPQFKALLKASMATNDALNAAQDVYDTTPAGIQDLKDTIADLEAGAGRPLIPGVTLVDSPEVERYYGRLDHAQAKRAEQIAAYKDAHGKKTATGVPATDMAPDSAQDEEAAAAPRPLCQCIDYRYKQTCPHVAAVTQTVSNLATRTGYDASMALHAAMSKRRTLHAACDDLGAARINPNGPDPAIDAAYAAARRDLANHGWTVIEAENAFYATPTGAAYLRRKAARQEALTGYRTSTSGQLEERATEGEKARAAAVKAYESITGKPAPTDPTTTPPDLPYGNGCTDKCDDFSWTGNCAHVDPDIARQDALVGAISGTLAKSSYGKALKKELGVGPDRPGLLGRLRARLTR